MRYFQIDMDGKEITVTQDDDGVFIIPNELRSNVTINRFINGAKPWGNAKGEEFDTESTTQGRWPSNLIIDTESAERLDVQTGNLPSRGGETSGTHFKNGIYHPMPKLERNVGYEDEGGASRFFYQVSTQLDEADPFLYCAKVSPKERNAGLGDEFDEKRTDETYRLHDDGSHGIQSRLHGATVKGKNIHPTLKPIDLAKYLATLLLPPNEYAPRRIFVPFSGSGSEMIGAGLAGWEHVVGVEFDKENGYVDVAMKRLEHWLK